MGERSLPRRIHEEGGSKRLTRSAGSSPSYLKVRARSGSDRATSPGSFPLENGDGVWIRIDAEIVPQPGAEAIQPFECDTHAETSCIQDDGTLGQGIDVRIEPERAVDNWLCFLERTTFQQTIGELHNGTEVGAFEFLANGLVPRVVGILAELAAIQGYGFAEVRLGRRGLPRASDLATEGVDVGPHSLPIEPNNPVAKHDDRCVAGISSKADSRLANELTQMRAGALCVCLGPDRFKNRIGGAPLGMGGKKRQQLQRRAASDAGGIDGAIPSWPRLSPFSAIDAAQLPVTAWSQRGHSSDTPPRPSCPRRFARSAEWINGREAITEQVQLAAPRMVPLKESEQAEAVRSLVALLRASINERRGNGERPGGSRKIASFETPAAPDQPSAGRSKRISHDPAAGLPLAPRANGKRVPRKAAGRNA